MPTTTTPKPFDFKRKPPYPPRPRTTRRPKVTIAAGFVCVDGVCLCSDSEHTVGFSKFYSPKIFEVRTNNALAYLTGAGSYSYIRAAVDEIAASIVGKNINLTQLELAAEEAGSRIYERFLAPARLAGDRETTFTLLLAAHVRDEAQVNLYRVEETGGIAKVTENLAIVGTDPGESVFRDQAELFFQDSMSVFTLLHLAPYIIRRVVRFASYCGGKPQVACIENNTGVSFFDNFASAEPGEDSLSDLLIDLPALLECCISPTGRLQDDAAFGAYLDRFGQRLAGARNRRKMQLGKAHPMEADGWSW